MVTHLGLELATRWLRLSPITLGRWRIQQWAKEAMNRRPRTGERIVRIRGGARFHAMLDEYLGKRVWLSGEYEPPVMDCMKALLKPGDTVLDIGANQGLLTLYAATLVQRGGRVVACEPVPLIREKLERNLKLNPKLPVEVWPLAMSDAEGVLEMHVGPDQHLGVSSMRPLPDARTVSIQTARLDDRWPDDRPIQLMKIDVEGAEMKVLRGAARTIARCRPVIILELTDSFLRELGDSAEALRDLLREWGYGLHVVTHEGVTRLPEAFGPGSQFNVVAMPDDAPPPKIAS